MTQKEFFKVIKVKYFFEQYCPGVKNFYHKFRGEDGNRNPLDFTEEDKKLMKEAAEKLGKKFSNVKF
jgi:hypothetical protein